ncbi:MAG: hypothetical protein ACM3S1_01455, partial [Hyphomicrobiales bacterium]
MREAGDFVRSMRSNFMGGRFADDTGWLVTAVEPGHYIALYGWGVFVLEEPQPGRTRLRVRSIFGPP